MKRKPNTFRKIRKAVLIVLVVFVVFFGVLLIPSTQTFLGKGIASGFAKRFDTQVNLGNIFISPLGYTSLNDVLALDHKNDTLIYIGSLKVSTLRLGAVLRGDNNLGSVTLRNVSANVITYHGEEDSNMSIFFDPLKKEDTDDPTATLYASSISLTESQLQIANQNETDPPLFFFNLNADINNFGIKGDTIEADIQHLDADTSLANKRFTSVSGHYKYSPTQMLLSEATIQTPSSVVDANIKLDYPEEGLQRFSDAVVMNIDVAKADFGEEDLKAILPSWPSGDATFSGKMVGTLQDFVLSDARVDRKKANMKFSLSSKNIFDKNHQELSGDWTINATEIMDLLPQSISEADRERIKVAGVTSTKGSFTLRHNVWNVNTVLNTSLGLLDIKALYKASAESPSYTLELTSTSFDVGVFTATPTLGTTGLNITLTGSGIKSEALNAQATGTLTNLVYRDYVYDKVTLTGNLTPQQFNGKMDISDDALDLALEGKIDFAAAVRNFSFTTDINRANFSVLGWIPESIAGEFSGSVDLALQGNSIDEMIGDLYIEQGKLKTPKKTYVFSSVAAQSRLTNDIRVINLSSEDIASGLIIGKFKPTELFKLMQNAVGSQFKNFTPHPVTPEQYVDFNFNVRGKIATALLGENITLDDNTFIKGKIYPEKKLFQVNIRAPYLGVKNTDLTNLTVQIDTKNPLYYSHVSMEKLQTNQTVFKNINWINSRIKDKLYGRAEFNSAYATEKINQFNTSFTIDEKSQMVLAIQSADFYFNNKHWQLDNNTIPTLTAKSTNDFALTALTLRSDPSLVSVEASQHGEDSFLLNLDFEQVALSDMLSFERNKWEGVVEGYLNVQQSESGFSGDSSLELKNLALNEVSLGDAYLTLQSQEQRQDYKLAFYVVDNNVEVVRATGTVGLKDQKPVWNINAAFNDYNLSVLEGLTQNVFAPFSGKANGNLQLVSKDDEIIPNGVLYVDEFDLGVPYLNTNYHFEKIVPFVFERDKISIQNARFYSGIDQNGDLNGILKHKSFSDWSLDMRIDAKNLNVLSTEFSEEALYYGNAFLVGSAHLYGPFSNMKIDVVGQTAPNTNLFIPIQYDTAIGDVSFINFVSKQDSEKNTQELAAKVEGLQLNFDLDVTPDAEVEIVVDPETKSTLRGKGAGNLLLEIDTAGSFAMWGDFIALEGEYNFKNLGLIDKNFRLRPGGTIVWEGDPYGAQLNMQAIYEVPGGANPAILLEGDNISQKISTEVTINLFGGLLNPETPTFEIDFPNASGVMKNELNYRLNDQERRQLQAISLLSQGSFINEVSLAAISSQTLTNNLFQKASGVFDNLFASENDQLNLSLDYLQGDRNAGVSIKNRDRLGVSLSTNINERILIDGKVGVPVGSEEETTIIGDVTLEFLLNKQGTLRARVFNRENEFQYFGDELGYTQGLGVSYQVRFDSFQELARKIFKKKPILTAENTD